MEAEQENILDDPRKINEYLSKRVFGQSEATKACSMFLYNHLHGNNKKQRCMAMVGPSGTGKTYIWDCLAELLDEYGDGKTKIVITDTSAISPTGYTGASPCSFMYELEEDVSYIVVLDEFCKAIAKERYSKTSDSIQGEYLSFVQPSQPYLYLNIRKNQDEPKRIPIGSFSWVFAGAFTNQADKIAERTKTSGLGFGSVKSQEKSYAKPLSLQDMIDYGMSRELAGRIGNVVNLNPIGEDGYIKLLTEADCSPVGAIEEEFRLPMGYIRKNIISEEQLKKLAGECEANNLGVRHAYSKIQSMTSDYIFNHFEDYQAVREPESDFDEQEPDEITEDEEEDECEESVESEKLEYVPAFDFEPCFEFSFDCRTRSNYELLKKMMVNFKAVFTLGPLYEADEQFIEKVSEGKEEMDMYELLQQLMKLLYEETKMKM
jgi:ATP-dependent protease Clp ATPase subunit